MAKRAACAAVVTDVRGAIVFYNQTAAELFHFDGREVAGRDFLAEVHGRDVFGNRFPDAGRTFETMVERGESLHRFAFDIKVDGRPLRLAVSAVVVMGVEDSDAHLVYEFEPVRRRRKTDLVMPAGGPRVGEERQPPKLTARQVEVTRLLADGESVEEIARRLGITPNTARNHIQNILERLGVHNRAAAVAMAIRCGLI